MAIVSKVVRVGGGREVLRKGERITVLGVGPVVVVGVISKAIMVEVVLSGGRGTPSSSGKGEASLIMGSGRGGIEVITRGL